MIDDTFDWEGDRPLRRPLRDTIVYEAHVKGFTKRHPDILETLRGTYAGLAHAASTDYLGTLGVTAVELLPIHQFVHEQHLLDRGLRNYWGYHSYGYFAPHGEYSASGNAGAEVREFKEMVKALHRAGLEVILDVVYNHTGEGNHLGPMLCLKGIDNRADGFRFALASTLARELYDVDRLSAFFDIIHQDPTLLGVKLIAEPWDVGPGGYQVGNFPVRWCEWNGTCRDRVRDYWRGEPGTLGALASRLTGSADLYANDGRRPYASVNFITAHDGFTLRDLVSYNEKHNEANGEGNADGEDHNRSWDCGAEGPTDDNKVAALRARQQRNFLTTLLLSQGIPMLLGGDEWGRTQGGNNNAYCQDNEISWFDWGAVDRELLAFTREIIHLRAAHPIFRRRRWFTGHPTAGGTLSDISWFSLDGEVMTEQDRESGAARSFAVWLNGDALPEWDEKGRQVRDDHSLLAFNAGPEPVPFTIPEGQFGDTWHAVLDTAQAAPTHPVRPGETLELAGRSVWVFSDNAH